MANGRENCSPLHCKFRVKTDCSDPVCRQPAFIATMLEILFGRKKERKKCPDLQCCVLSMRKLSLRIDKVFVYDGKFTTLALSAEHGGISFLGSSLVLGLPCKALNSRMYK